MCCNWQQFSWILFQNVTLTSIMYTFIVKFMLLILCGITCMFCLQFLGESILSKPVESYGLTTVMRLELEVTQFLSHGHLFVHHVEVRLTWWWTNLNTQSCLMKHIKYRLLCRQVMFFSDKNLSCESYRPTFQEILYLKYLAEKGHKMILGWTVNVKKERYFGCLTVEVKK